MILTSFFKALGQLPDRRFQAVLLRGIGLTILLLIAVTAMFVWTLSLVIGPSISLPLIGEIEWAARALSFGAVFMMMGLSVFLMVPVASAMTSIFLDDVAEAVEARHYPSLPAARKMSITEALSDSLTFLGVMILANIAAIALYLMFPPAAVFIFWGLNGFLLGREYFTLVALRRMKRDQAKKLRKKHSGTIWLAGTLMAVPLSIPLINLIIPILGAATFTHIFQRITQAGSRG